MFSRRLGLSALLLAAALTGGCAGTRGARAPAASAVVADDAELPLDPAVKIGKLANGLTYYVRANAKPEDRAELWLAVDAGSVLEDDDQRGLAHFVEHMAFNGTRRFAKQEIVDFLELAGMSFGPDLNAYTSFDETVYNLRIPTEDDALVEKALQVLEDWASAVTFEDEEIEKERGVVLEEWRLGRGADARIQDKQMPVLLQGSRYAERLPIGDVETLRTAAPETLRRFYRDWYRPELMAVIAVGDFDPAEMELRIRQHFAGLAGPPLPRARVEPPVPDHDETLVSIETDPEQTDTTVGVLYKLPKRETRTVADLRRSLIEVLYHGAINSRLDERTREADCPFLYAYSGSGDFVRTRDVYVQGAGLKGGMLLAGLDELLSEVERVDRHGFAATELEREKLELLRSLETLHRERDREESSNLAQECLAHFLDDEPMPGIENELALAKDLLPGIPVEEVNRLTREWITERNRVVLVAAPGKDAAVLPRESDLLALFREVERKDLPAYVDQVREEPLLPVKPAPATIVERSSVAELSVTRWRLSNGVTVLLKPTDFKNDEIVLEGWSPGGSSLVPDERYATAEWADWIVGAGGAGNFSEVELDKALAGKIASASMGIDELEETAYGSASPEDVATMFELLYLSATAPRRDEQAFGAWKAQQRDYLQNRLSDPDAVFGDRMQQTIWQNHPRRQPPSLERIEQVDLDLALEIYRERMADLGDATFVLVGNFDVEQMEPLVRTYLGGLPSAGRVETWRDIGLERPEGVQRFEVERGLEPKSRVELLFHGELEWSPELEHDLASIADALAIRLREVLREDLGGTYGVSVSGRLRIRPHGRYAVRFAFGCAPESVDGLIAALFDEIERVQREGVAPEIVSKVQEAQLREHEEELETNSFWLDALADHYRHDRDPRAILSYPARVRALTSERIRETARRLLDQERYVLGVLRPEASTGTAAGP